jgi:hypothetical protein
MTLRSIAVACLLACAVAPVFAHDTWFQPLPAAPGARLLALGTGNRYPVQETGVGEQFLARQGCRDEGRTAAMQALRNDSHALVLKAGPAAQSCWAQLVPLEIELPASKVAVYLREIQASAEVRRAWARLQEQGLPWKETYTKHARIDFAPASGTPSPMAMDIVWEPAADGSLSFRVMRDGAPLAGLAMELQSDAATLGIWRRSDADGRIRIQALPAGHWVLRGTDLRPAANDARRWDSRFVTLAFEVPAAGGMLAGAPAPLQR